MLIGVTTLHIAALVDLIVCWILWAYPLVSRARKQRHRESVVTAPVGKWGVWVQTMAYFVACLRIVRSHPQPLLIASMIIGPLSTLLVWQAVGHLGRHWRIQAGLYADHELVRTGPYHFVRHPIYASMLGMLVASGLVMTRWEVLIIALAIFIIGTEIRVRAEDGLLESRFGETFRAYRSAVPAYIPFVR
jgi:protein-S-isoprenylcysteine O-methyltransferase Ste14